MPWTITHCEVYKVETSDLEEYFDPSIDPAAEANKTHIRVALALNDPAILYNSLVLFYDVTFDSPGALPKYRKNQEVSMLSVNILGLDSFTVNSMALIGESAVLALGIENYGIIFYCILDFRVLRYVSLVDLYGEPFLVNSIVPQGQLMMLMAMVNNQAIYSISVAEKEDVIDYDPQEIETLFDFQKITIENIYLDS